MLEFIKRSHDVCRVDLLGRALAPWLALAAGQPEHRAKKAEGLGLVDGGMVLTCPFEPIQQLSLWLAP